MKIRFYLHSTVGGGFTQVALWPSLFLVHNKISPYTRLLVLSASVLFWDLGITFEWEKL
jgi:hypothetical protein